MAIGYPLKSVVRRSHSFSTWSPTPACALTFFSLVFWSLRFYYSCSWRNFYFKMMTSCCLITSSLATCSLRSIYFRSRPITASSKTSAILGFTGLMGNKDWHSCEGIPIREFFPLMPFVIPIVKLCLIKDDCGVPGELLFSDNAPFEGVFIRLVLALWNKFFNGWPKLRDGLSSMIIFLAFYFE